MKFYTDSGIINVFLPGDLITSKIKFDAIVNCIGFGTPEKIGRAGINIFKITESIDDLIIEYLVKKPETVYINFSSGSVYGSSFEKPVDSSYKSVIKIQPLEDREFYRIAKLNSEAKHRSLNDLQIIDIRLFSFFSRFIDL